MIKIDRTLTTGRYKVADAFPDIRKEPILIEIFGNEKTVDEVFKSIDINIIDAPHYMNVNNENGTINIGLGHLRNSDDEVLYLDILHELCHVKQQREGAVLYRRDIPYVDWPTEIEAYEIAVKVARRMGMTDREIENYLYVEWASPQDNAKLAKRLNVKAGPLI